MTGTGNAVATSLVDRGGSLLAVEDLFVSIDLDADVALGPSSRLGISATTSGVAGAQRGTRSGPNR